jgi:hypothetical protein
MRAAFQTPLASWQKFPPNNFEKKENFAERFRKIFSIIRNPLVQDCCIEKLFLTKSLYKNLVDKAMYRVGFPGRTACKACAGISDTPCQLAEISAQYILIFAQNILRCSYRKHKKVFRVLKI